METIKKTLENCTNKYKINLVTSEDVQEFTAIAEKLQEDGHIYVCNSNGGFPIEAASLHNAASLLGVYAMKVQWGDLWVYSEKNIYAHIHKFVVVE